MIGNYMLFLSAAMAGVQQKISGRGISYASPGRREVMAALYAAGLVTIKNPTQEQAAALFGVPVGKVRAARDELGFAHRTYTRKTPEEIAQDLGPDVLLDIASRTEAAAIAKRVNGTNGQAPIHS
jgi:hypothetical protein